MRLACPLVVLLALPLAAQAPRRVPALAIEHVTVIDATGAPPLPDATVIVSDRRITAVGSAARVRIPRGARVVDGRRKFLVPGLSDMHVHLSLARASALPALVANGVTSVRDMGGMLVEIDEWRTRVDDGLLAGPRIVRAGPTLNGREFGIHHVAVTNDAEARAAVRTLKKVGVDFLKVHRALPREAYFALAQEATALSLPFAGHVPASVSPTEAAEAGQASLEHTETLFEGTFGAQAAGRDLVASVAQWRQEEAPRLWAALVKSRTSFTPMLVAYRTSIVARAAARPDPNERYVAASAKKAWQERPLPSEAIAARTRLLGEFLQAVGAMHRAGVNVMAGTDLADGRAAPGFTLHDELALLVQAGLSPLAALQAATRNPARFFGQFGTIGTIERGAVADLLLVDANPLEDIRNLARIRAVVVNGALLDRARLDALLAEAAALAAKI